jgi:hypothetical protein
VLRLASGNTYTSHVASIDDEEEGQEAMSNNLSLFNMDTTPAIVRKAEDLAGLLAAATAEHEAGLRAERASLEHYRKAGQALLKAKAAAGHGSWLKVLKRTGIPQQHRYREARRRPGHARLRHRHRRRHRRARVGRAIPVPSFEWGRPGICHRAKTGHPSTELEKWINRP